MDLSTIRFVPSRDFLTWNVIGVGVGCGIGMGLLLSVLRKPQASDPPLSDRAKRALLRDKYSASKIATATSDDDFDYIVIGAGMSGLSCSAILSRLGNKVLVLDQHEDVAGGGTHMFDLKGYPFDSGLHYTVPWSEPLLALTTGKKTRDCTQFKLMGEENGTVDKIYLVRPDGSAVDKRLYPFCMKHGETHWSQLLEIFPQENECLKQFTILSDRSMVFVKVYCFIRLFPKYLQEWIWSCFVPRNIVDPVNTTAKELLPTITENAVLRSLLSSMWIDTGARPDRASFMMTASVFRGISMEGGCYPLGGSEAMGIELAEVIRRNEGKLFIRAPVEKIYIENNQVKGVIMSDRDKTLLKAKKGVISSAGYVNTFTKLVDSKICDDNNIPREILNQSAGFVVSKQYQIILSICDSFM